MTPAQLKESILQYSIQGKLVEQRPEEGTAEDLLQEITEEKKKLISEGKIPKEKSLSEISEDEKEFIIPNNWRYVRVQDIASYITDYVANGSFAKQIIMKTKRKEIEKIFKDNGHADKFRFDSCADGRKNLRIPVSMRKEYGLKPQYKARSEEGIIEAVYSDLYKLSLQKLTLDDTWQSFWHQQDRF